MENRYSQILCGFDAIVQGNELNVRFARLVYVSSRHPGFLILPSKDRWEAEDPTSKVLIPDQDRGINNFWIDELADKDISVSDGQMLLVVGSQYIELLKELGADNVLECSKFKKRIVIDSVKCHLYVLHESDRPFIETYITSRLLEVFDGSARAYRMSSSVDTIRKAFILLKGGVQRPARTEVLVRGATAATLDSKPEVFRRFRVLAESLGRISATEFYQRVKEYLVVSGLGDRALSQPVGFRDEIEEKNLILDILSLRKHIDASSAQDKERTIKLMAEIFGAKLAVWCLENGVTLESDRTRKLWAQSFSFMRAGTDAYLALSILRKAVLAYYPKLEFDSHRNAMTTT
ncbi:MAG: hypothetical protein AAF791_07820, partial [Bacteroidota bacterium]